MKINTYDVNSFIGLGSKNQRYRFIDHRNKPLPEIALLRDDYENGEKFFRFVSINKIALYLCSEKSIQKKIEERISSKECRFIQVISK